LRGEPPFAPPDPTYRALAALVLERDPAVDSAALAARLGWYDQAHFINEFRSMLGCTPGEYAARHG
jgi:AraC-like DNA-binding protein